MVNIVRRLTLSPGDSGLCLVLVHLLLQKTSEDRVASGVDERIQTGVDEAQ